MKRLNQILAVESATKKRIEDTFTKVYQEVQKGDLTSGFTRVYTPKNEEGERFPSETKRVTVKVDDAVGVVKQSMQELFDLTATKDLTNAGARANIVVEGKTVAQNVPAVHLLFIEKRLASLIDFIRKLPVLSLDESWISDPASGLFVSSPVDTIKTAKLEDHQVVVQATDKFPAQVVKTTKDVVQGSWRTTKFSGALTPDRKAALLAKAEAMQRAVKSARQEANEHPVQSLATGQVLDFIFG